MGTVVRNIKNDIARLRRHSPVRQAAQAIDGGQEVPAEMVEMLLATMRSDFLWSRREHLVAAWAIGNVPLNGAQRLDGLRCLTKLLLRQSGKGVWRAFEVLGRLGAVFAIFSIFFVVYFLIIAVIMWAPEWLTGFLAGSAGAVAAVTCTSIFVVAAALLDIVDRDSIESVAIESVGRIGGWECLGPLTMVALGPKQSTSRSAQLVLVQVLTDLSSEQRTQIRLQAKMALASLLDLSLGHARHKTRFSLADDRLCLQILLLLRDVGGGESIAVVEKAARSDTSPSRRQLASEIFPLLRARLQKEQAATGLLRVADGNPTDVLLRPAANFTLQHLSNNLVRAATSAYVETDSSTVSTADRTTE